MKKENSRLNVLISKQLHENLNKIATMKRVDVTGIVNECLQKYVDENQAAIDWYDDVFVKNNRLDDQTTAGDSNG